MNRDAIIATVVGFGIGLVITGIFLLGPNLVKFLPKLSFPDLGSLMSQTKTTPTPSPAPVTLTIDAPLPESIDVEGSALVSGTSPAHSLVVIEGPENEIVVAANGDGKYAGKVSLLEGKNDIVVTSYADNKSLHQSVAVFYTPEKF